MQYQIYDPLLAFGEGTKLEPSVITKWDLDAAGTMWTFTIRTDMKWPDGSAVTVDDVLFTFETINSQSWGARANFVGITEFAKAGETAFTARTRAPDMSVPATMPSAFLLPKAYITNVGIQGFIAKPVGSGPYELAEFRASDSARFTKRAQAHAFRRPENNELIFRAVPEQQQVLNGLRTGDLDAATVFVFSGEQIDSMKRDGMEVLDFLVSNIALAFPQGTATSKNSPLTQVKVRQALNYAVNRQQIASLYRGAMPAGQFAIPTSGYWDKDVPAWPTDVNRAKALLAEAGYPNGFKAQMEYQPNTLNQQVVLAVQGMLKEVGVEVEAVALDFVTNADKTFGRNNTTKADIFGTVTGDSTGFVTSVRNTYGCGKPLGAPGTALFWCNQDWERLMDQAIQERDQARREALWRQANKLMRDDAHVLHLLVIPAQNIMGAKTKGQKVGSFQNFNLDSLYKIK
jgi:peptide/nickel transport system substrate-binding protein